MQIVPSTLIVLALIALIAVRGPFRGLIVLLALTPMGMLAAFNLPAVGGTSILAVDLAVLALFGLLFVRGWGRAGIIQAFAPGGPGVMLLLFLGYATLATLFFPRVFAGQTDVFGIGRVANVIGIVVRPLGPSGGNLSQLMRMILSVMAFAAAAALIRRRPDPDLVLKGVVAATGVHVAMGVIDILTNAAGLAWVLSPIRTANYALTLGQKMAGLNRMIGGFPEASAYGYFSLGMFGFWLSYWFSDRSGARGPAILLALSAFVLLRGTSSSAYVAGALLCIVFAITQMTRARSDGMSRRTATILVACLAALPVAAMTAYVLYETLPAVSGFIDRSLLSKLTSDSGTERMSWNTQALRNFADTWTLGAGLGSVRASNWVVACLGTTGLVGTWLMLAFQWRVFRAKPRPEADAVTVRVIAALKWGCAGFLIRALVAQGSPNLHIVFFTLAGLIAGLTAVERTEKARPGTRVFRSVRARNELREPAWRTRLGL